MVALAGERSARQTRGAAALRYGAAAASVVAGPGSQALIQALSRISPQGAVGALGPTYSGFASAFAAAGAGVVEVKRLEELDGFDVAIVVNPNNPDGRITPRSALLDLHARLARRGGLLIVDEAFADFDAESESLAPMLPTNRAVVLRSFGKSYGLAGLRLGFALASPDIAAPLRAALGPWPVSGPAIAIGARALADSDWLEAMRGAPRRRSRAARRSPARRRLANHRRHVALSTGRSCPMRAPPSNGYWPQESSPALSQTLRTGCDSGFRATRTHGNGSPRRCEGKLESLLEPSACLPPRAA